MVSPPSLVRKVRPLGTEPRGKSDVVAEQMVEECQLSIMTNRSTRELAVWFVSGLEAELYIAPVGFAVPLQASNPYLYVRGLRAMYFLRIPPFHLRYISGIWLTFRYVTAVFLLFTCLGCYSCTELIKLPEDVVSTC